MFRSTLAPLPLSLLLTAPAAFGADTPTTPVPATAPATETKKTEKLDEVVVQGEAQKEPSSPKYTEPLKDTPQTITVVPASVIQQQGASTLAQVLKNSPGISMQAGEGGVPNGDNLSIRGFTARTDMFVNGIRDFGGYSRDPFNLEQVEIIKGPSSSNAGRGSTGGSINLVTKTAKKDSFYQGTAGFGTDAYKRMTLDINQSLDGGEGKDGIENAAFRINLMGHAADAPGRNVVENKRLGVAPTITFGLGTPTQLTLDYFHMSQDNIPDYGIPWVPATNAAANPGTLGQSADKIAPVPYDNFYGLKTRDYEKVVTNIGSINFVHDFENGATLNNRTQYGATQRDSVVTAPRFATATSPLIRRTDMKSRDQVDTILANQTNLLFQFDTGTVKHKLTAGAEFSQETSKNHNRVESNPNSVTANNNTNLFNPDPYQPYNSGIRRDGAKTQAIANSLAAYAFDTIDLSEQWALTGGLRWDRFDVDYKSQAATGATAALGKTDDMLSYRGGVVYKPAKNGSIYASYGTSFNPSAEGLTLANTATAANSINLDPEQSGTYEIGTKWNFLKERLLLSAAVFCTDKTNARTEDPTNPGDVIALDGKQRVQGIELGATGQLTTEWSLIGGYAWMESEILESRNALEKGKQLANTPEHTISLWTTYAFNFGLDIGGGASYVSSRFANTTNTREADGYVTFDAMVAYHINNHFTVRLNGYNLGDERYLSSLGGGHAIPGAGRSAVLSADFSF